MADNTLTWVFGLEFGHVVNIFVYNDPEIVGFFVCRDVALRECLRHNDS